MTILSALRLKTLCQGYNIADCPVFGSRHHYAMANKTVSFPLKKHHLLADGLLCCVCVCNPNRAGVKTAKYSSGERHFFFFFLVLTQAPPCSEPNVRFHRSAVVPVPVPVDYTTMTMPALVTLNTNKQDLNKVISRRSKSELKGRSVSQSLGVFGIISVDFL